MPDPANPPLTAILARAHAAPARLGSTRLVLVDGRAGAGKSTLAARLGAALGAQVLHGDDMYEGWTGLTTLWGVLGDQILAPLAAGRPGSFRRWDWGRAERAEAIEVPPAPFLVVEGVGVAQEAARPYASVVVWVDAPWDERLRRGLERDGDAMRDDWERWEADERHFHVQHGTDAAADILIDGTAPIAD